MTERFGDYRPRWTNEYVPAMVYAADVVHMGPTRIDLGTPTIADINGVLGNVAADQNGPYTYTPGDGNMETVSGFNGSTGEFTDAPFGRGLTAAGNLAGVTQTLTVKGRDYLGQPLTKSVTMSGTTTVSINVAFKYIDSVTIGLGAASETINVGFSDLLGLPYKTIRVLSEENNGTAVGTVGSFTGPVLIDPATATTGDPRGMFNPTTVLNGNAKIMATILCDTYVNANGNGGLHGIKHYFA